MNGDIHPTTPSQQPPCVGAVWAWARPGFTLVELLSVIAIVGILLSMLLPAAQSIREASRKTQCVNRQKQLALAALAYESGRRTLPVGSHNSHWRTWLVQMMPYIEEQAFYDAYDHRLYLSDSKFNSGRNATLTARPFSELACPNDPPVHTTFGPAASAHSYVACTGNGKYLATDVGWNTTPPISAGRKGSFGHGGGKNNTMGGGGKSGGGPIQRPVPPTVAPLGPAPTPLLPTIAPAPVFRERVAESTNAFLGGAYQMSGGSTDLEPAEDPALLRDAIAVRLSDITDGTSKTLAFAEVIRGTTEDGTQSSDYRGLSWWGPGALFSTHGTPNSHLPDVMPRQGDCVSDEQAPCLCPHTRHRPMYMLARSRHPGGVVAATCDGAVAFYHDEVDAIVWEHLGSTQGDPSR